MMVASHYLNQCWLHIGEVLWHLPESTFMMSVQTAIQYSEFEKYTFKSLSIFPASKLIGLVLMGSYVRELDIANWNSN